MISSARQDLDIDRRQLVVVTFERESPESNAPTLVATFLYTFPEDFMLTSQSPGVLSLLSCVRKDTGEAIPMTPEERLEVFKKASEYALTLVENYG